MALDQIWMSTAFAVEAVLAAWLWRRLPAPLLRYAIAGFGLLATARLTILGEAFAYDVGLWPIFNLLLIGYGVTAIMLWLAAEELRRGGERETSAILQGLETGALVLASSLVVLEIRHALNGGDLNAPMASLNEVGLQITALLLIASALRWRFANQMRFGPRWIERLGLVAAGSLYIGVLSLLTNPWWGIDDRVEADIGLASLLLAYGLPVIGLGLYRVALVRSGSPLQSGWIHAGLLIGTIQLNLLLIRYAYQGPYMGHAGIGQAETWTYSVFGIGFAGVLLALGVIRQQAAARYASLAMLLIVTGKVFLFDLAGLDGLWRAASLLGLGGSLIAIALLYQRVILPKRTVR